MVKLKYFLDTEFIERVQDGLSTVCLLSLAIVCEDGRSLYRVNEDADHSRACDWVKANVLPKLYSAPGARPGVHRKPRSEIAKDVLDFVDQGGSAKPEFWAYFGDYDWVVFCGLFGRMIDLPEGFPMFAMDLKQTMVEHGIRKDQLPPQPPPDHEHNAWHDAMWLSEAYAWTQQIIGGVRR